MNTSNHSLTDGVGYAGDGRGQPATTMLGACIRDLSIRRLVMAQQAAAAANAIGVDPTGGQPGGPLNPMAGTSLHNHNGGGGMMNHLAASRLGDGIKVEQMMGAGGGSGRAVGGIGGGAGGGSLPHLADYAGTAADAFAQAFVDRWASIHSQAAGGVAEKHRLTDTSNHSLSSDSVSNANRWTKDGSDPTSGSTGGTNKPWFVCDFCKNKAFVSKDELKDHEAVCEKNTTRPGLGAGDGGEKTSVGGGAEDMPASVRAALLGGGATMHSAGSMGTVSRDAAMNSAVNSQSAQSGMVGHHPMGQRAASMIHGMNPYISMNPYMSALSGADPSMMMNPANMMLFGVVPQLPGSLGGMGMHSIAEAAAQSAEQAARRKSSTQVIDPALIEASKGPFRQLPKPTSLALDEDKDWLTALHCFVRKNCVEVFTATALDVLTPSKGKRKPIQVGQVGIRCPHCHEGSVDTDPNRERGSVYYPAALSSIYNATMNLLQRHLHSCPKVPAHILEKYIGLKKDDARSGTSKKYWVESAKSMGFVDTLQGIRLSAKKAPPPPSTSESQNQTKEARTRIENDAYSDSDGNEEDVDDKSKPSDSAEDKEDVVDDIDGRHDNFAFGKDKDSVKKDNVDDEEKEDKTAGSEKKKKNPFADAPPLVIPADEATATQFSFLLLSQMQPCVFTEADRLGKRKGLPTGFAGLACRHCFGGYGSGRFFPSSIKTLSDTSKTLNVLHNHMSRCRKLPKETLELLEAARITHDEDRAKMKFGSQKAFFAKIWSRLHDNRPDGAVIKPPPRKSLTTGVNGGLRKQGKKGDGIGNDLSQASNAMAMHRLGYVGMGTNGMMMPQVGMNGHMVMGMGMGGGASMGIGMGGMPHNMMPHPMMMAGGIDHQQMMAQMMGGGFQPGFPHMGGMGMTPQAMAQMMGGGGGMGVGSMPQNMMHHTMMMGGGLQHSSAGNDEDSKRSLDMLSSQANEMRKRLKMTPNADV
ncbi:hypothetical protein ACHAXA_008076 [Cyclostephanos tholiformis]|uniref:C2H2-type domain-containing protein n=1 Tax=Cyclostephanos tholiformis TaxID=382380 RepID=A0ABD3RVN8_9STRA